MPMPTVATHVLCSTKFTREALEGEAASAAPECQKGWEAAALRELLLLLLLLL